MSESSAPSEISRYEQACDQAIAMCDGNMRSTIKALIMANEYLENELQELQMAASNAPAALPRAGAPDETPVSEGSGPRLGAGGRD